MTLGGHHIYLVLCRDQKIGVAVESQCEQKKTPKEDQGLIVLDDRDATLRIK
jgi:hypothetical protein